jgi:diguanylate cyclase (GGDEF)-like protein
VPKNNSAGFYNYLLPFAYIGIPLVLFSPLNSSSLKIIFLFYFIIGLIGYLSFMAYLSNKDNFKLAISRSEEKINLITAQNRHYQAIRSSLKEKIGRYNQLKEIVQDINQSLDLETTANCLTEIAFHLIGNSRGSCILYLIDQKTQNLAIFKTKKEDRHLVIKQKQGDIFDIWVLRHMTPLLIGDVKSDFRFDVEAIESERTRGISSVIIAPLIANNRFIGALRLESSQQSCFSQDDLRFLVTLSELGAVALENSELFEHTEELALRDGLTQLYTKGHFLQCLKEEYARCLAKKHALSVIMLDIDYFKSYNDKFGHTAGDIVLRELSRCILGVLKGHDAVASRFGGEEFCIFIPTMSKPEVKQIAEKMRKEVEQIQIELRRKKTSVTVSIGAACFPDDASNEEELMLKADMMLYKAKDKGRNRVVCL